MATTPTSPEQSREFALRSLPGVRDAGLTAEQKAFVAEVRRRAQEDPRAAAERMKQARERQPKPVPQAEIDLVIKNNTKETGKIINGIDVEQRAKVVNKYIETGILDPAEQTIILTEIREQLKNDQNISDVLSAIPTINQNAFLDEMILPLLKDQRGRQIVSQLFNETMDKSKMFSRQQIQDAKKIADEASDEASKIVPQLDEIRTSLPIKEARLEEFADGTGGTPKGPAYLELEKAKKALPANKGKLVSNQRQQQRIRDYLAALDNTRAAILSGRAAGDITAVEGVIAAQETNLNKLAQEEIPLQEVVDKPQKLQEEWDGLKQEVPRLQAQEKDLDRKYQNLYGAWEGKDQELTNAETLNKNREESFKREAAGVFNTAVRRLLEEKVQVHESKQEEYIEELKKTATSDAERELLNAYMQRWATGKVKGRGPFGSRGIFGETEITILNKQQTLDDFHRLFARDASGARILNPDGTKNLIRAILPDPPYSDEQVKTVMESDNFKNNILPQVLVGLIARKMQADPRGLTPREADLILSASWGEKVIENALKKNPEAQKKIDDLRAKGAITGTTAEWLRKHGGKNVLLVLLGILGATATGLLLTPALTAGFLVPAISSAAVTGGSAAAGGYGIYDKLRG